jgi:hypothetical protein
MSSAPSVAAVISLLDTLKKYEREHSEISIQQSEGKEAQS